MRTYYLGHDVVVTSEFFVRRSTPTKSYAICDLRNVRIACGRDTGRARPLVAAAVGGLGLVGAVSAWAAGSLDALIALTLASPLAAAGTLIWPRRSVKRELQASYHGRSVILFESFDETVFNQVTRALRRAVEADRRPPTYAA